MPVPTKKTPDVLDEILQQVASEGNLDRILASSERYPRRETWDGWVKADDDLARRYLSAKQSYAAKLVFEAKEIADGVGVSEAGYNDKKVGHQVKTRLWMAEKLDRSNFGLQQRLEHVGEDGGPIKTIHTLTDDELMRIATAKKGKGDE